MLTKPWNFRSFLTGFQHISKRTRLTVPSDHLVSLPSLAALTRPVLNFSALSLREYTTATGHVRLERARHWRRLSLRRL